MDPYDLPEQLSVLQSYDMSKIGFIQDLTRGIAKVLDADKKPVQKETPAAPQSNTAPLLRRAFMFLEDANWTSAEEYCEKILDLEPENAMAYVGKLMAKCRVTQMEKLEKLDMDLETMGSFRKALRFGDDQLKQTLNGYVESAKNRKLDAEYQETVKAMHRADNSEKYLRAAKAFERISQHRDSGELAVQCREKAKLIENKKAYKAAIEEKKAAITDAALLVAAVMFQKLGDFEDSQAQAEECRKEAETLQEKARRAWADYQACQAMDESGSREDLRWAMEQFRNMGNYKDSRERLSLCKEKLNS